MLINITEMSVGQRARVDRFFFKEIPLPLLEMGCLKGAEVVFLKKALWGCPLYLEIDGMHFVIRERDAENIIVATT